MRELFQAFLSGDDAAFAELYRDLNPRLSAYCYKLSRENWEDVMQELWERVIAMRNLRMGGGDGAHHAVESPVAFLFQMARNLVVDHFRKRMDSRELLETDGEQPVADSDLETIVLESLEHLPFDDRELLVLNVYSGYQFGEIAEMQSKSPEAVWQQASRARKKLRELVIRHAKQIGVGLPMNTAINGSLLRAKEKTIL